MSGAPLVGGGAPRTPAATDEFFDAKDADTVATIKDLIETRVRPAVAGDGGDITFKGYKEGVVYLRDEGRLLGLPVLDRHAPARHPEPAQALRARRAWKCGRSKLPQSALFLRHGRACPGHPRFKSQKKGVDARHKAGHDGDRLVIMRILAIDTALEACSAAVLDTEHGGAIAHESLADGARPRRGADAADRARARSRPGGTFTEIDRIAVTTGPGSFTGLRVGIAAARGIALAAGKPAIGLSTLAAYAAPFIAADDTLPVVAAIDARHDHVYLQVFGPAAARWCRRG